MATFYVSLTPSCGEPTYPIKEAAVPDIEGSYTHAEVVEGTWIFYAKKNFGDASGSQYKILDEGANEDLGFAVKSCRMIAKGANIIILFEHTKFCGKMKAYSQGCGDITPTFPDGKVEGASSGIIFKTMRWLLYRGKNYEGAEYTRSPGEYDNPGSLCPGANDKIQSIKPE